MHDLHILINILERLSCCVAFYASVVEEYENSLRETKTCIDPLKNTVKC